MMTHTPSCRIVLLLAGTVVLLGAAAVVVFLPRTAPRERSPSGQTLEQTLPTHPTISTIARTPTPEESAALQQDKIISIIRKLRTQSAQRHPSTQALLSKLLDKELSLAQRIQALRNLTQSADREATMEAFLQILNGEEPVALQAEVLRALGEIGASDVRPLLESYLNDASLPLWIGAMQGLAALNDPNDFALFVDYLEDARVPMEVRAEAAALMAKLDPTQAAAELTRTFSEVASAELAGDILEAMGTLPFSDSKAFYQALLDDPSLPPELQLQALESLAEVDGDASPLLLAVATQSQDPELRSAAIASLGDAELPETTIAPLLELLATEDVPEVRAELYRALALNSEWLDTQTLANDLIPRFQTEGTPLAQIELARIVASRLQNKGDNTFVSVFDAQMVSRLSDIALTTPVRFELLLALDTLAGAGTPGALKELQRLAQTAPPMVATEAQRALDRFSPQ